MATISAPKRMPAGLESVSATSRRSIHNRQPAQGYPVGQLEQAIAYLCGRHRVSLPCWVGPASLSGGVLVQTCGWRVPYLPWSFGLTMTYLIEGVSEFTDVDVTATLSNGLTTDSTTDTVAVTPGAVTPHVLALEVGVDEAPINLASQRTFDLEVSFDAVTSLAVATVHAVHVYLDPLDALDSP